jgi:predicted enzyme related to lactoylglutathione lyase
MIICTGSQQLTPEDTKEKAMIQGLRTVIYHVEDLEKAKKWYTKLLGVKPYFDEPFYVGYNVGGFELGLDPDMTDVSRGNNAVAYWGVKDVKAAHKRIQELGAKNLESPRHVGEGIIVTKLVDPFGNVLGIIENPHFKFEGGE